MATQMPNLRGRKLERRCSYCGKIAEESSSYLLDNERIIELACGHTYAEKTEFLRAEQYAALKSERQGFTPYPYQIDGLKFAEAANFRVLFADEPGLGKTIQALLSLKSHPDLFPVLIVVRSQLLDQWFYEGLEWTGIPFQVIKSSKETPEFSFFKVCIVSMDTLRECTWIKDDAKLEALGIKTLIIDECQHLKNPEAKRTHAVRKIAARVKNIMALSGTPIKNHAGEYFTILNMLQPGKFPTLVNFYRNWVDVYNDGFKNRVGGIKSYRVKEFQQYTKDFIIRRTRAEVLPDLPKVRRNFKPVPFSGDKEMHDAYRATMKDFLDEYDSEGLTQKSMMNLLAYLAKLRHIAGLSKVNPAVDMALEFLEGTDRKLVLFHHHKDVGQRLEDLLNYELNVREVGDALKGIKVVRLESGSDANFAKEQQFKNDPQTRVLIASTLSSGEGKNWQFCSDCIVVERQWNSVNEEQAEGRFTRPGSVAEYVNIDMIHVLETVDDYFNDIVAKKREVFTRTMDHRALTYDEESLLREMSTILASKGRKAWRL